MRTVMKKITLSLAALLALCTLAGPARAQQAVCSLGETPAGDFTRSCFEDGDVMTADPTGDYVWTKVGSVGSVDESSISRFAFLGPVASLRSNRTGAVILRYGLECDRPSRLRTRYFKIRFKDDGADARVTAKLVRSHVDGYESESIDLFDSDWDITNSEAVQTFTKRSPRPIVTCGGDDVWHVEVRLEKSGDGDPQVSLLRFFH